jgi:hydrogenase maturation factor HypF (carbamoyltransferase family)
MPTWPPLSDRMRLRSPCRGSGRFPPSRLHLCPFDFIGVDPFKIDLRNAIRSITTDFLQGTAVPTISARFHRTMAQVSVDACLRIRESDGLKRVCLSGGTFQNLRLLEHSVTGLRERGFDVFVHQRVPPNDGGLSLGQAVIASQRIDRPDLGRVPARASGEALRAPD